MALLHSDSFDGYNPRNVSTYYGIDDKSGKYESYPTQSSSYSGPSGQAPAPRTGVATTFKLGFITKNLLNNYSTIVVGFAYILFSNNTKTILKLIDDTTDQLYLFVNSSRKIQVIRGDGTVLGTSKKTLTVNVWTYIELKVNIGNSGSFELRIDAVTDISSSADTQNTGNSYVNKVALGNSGTINDGFDDYYIESSVFLGAVKIYRVRPQAGFSVAWTPLTGNNLSNILDTGVTQNSDVNYVSATASNIKDLYYITNPIFESGVIKAVVHNLTARTTDGNPPTSIIPIIKLGSTEYTGSSKTLTTEYTCYQTIWETNPATSTTWTESDINDLIAGMKTE